MRTAEDFSISYANAPSCNFFPYLIASARLRGRGFLNRTIQHSDFVSAINRFSAPTENLAKNFFAACPTSFSLTPIVALRQANESRSAHPLAITAALDCGRCQMLSPGVRAGRFVLTLLVTVSPANGSRSARTRPRLESQSLSWFGMNLDHFTAHQISVAEMDAANCAARDAVSFAAVPHFARSATRSAVHFGRRGTSTRRRNVNTCSPFWLSPCVST